MVNGTGHIQEKKEDPDLVPENEMKVVIEQFNHRERYRWKPPLLQITSIREMEFQKAKYIIERTNQGEVLGAHETEMMAIIT